MNEQVEWLTATVWANLHFVKAEIINSKVKVIDKIYLFAYTTKIFSILEKFIMGCKS